MKPVLNLLLSVSLLPFGNGNAFAGEPQPSPSRVKFIYDSKDTGRLEVETESVLEYSTVTVPLVINPQTTWICRLNPNETTGVFTVTTLDSERVDADGKVNPVTLLQTAQPFQNGKEQVLVKSSAFTLSAMVTQQPPDKTLGTAAEPAAPKPPSNQLSAEEAGKISLSAAMSTSVSSGGFPALILEGYNPFPRPLGKGVVRVTLPGTGGTPETVRDYQVQLQAAALADFRTSVGVNLKIPDGVKLDCKLVQIEFAR